MIEREYKLSKGDEKTIEKVVFDENLHYQIHEYAAGTLLKIPYQTKMIVRNLHTETLELIVVKAPAPKN
jgi:hypothetical protein